MNDDAGNGAAGDKDNNVNDSRIRWPADTDIQKSGSNHVTVGAQSKRVQVVFDKCLVLADRIFYFTNPYLEYPNKLVAYRRLLIDAANDQSINDTVLARRWSQDSKQMMLAKNIVSFLFFRFFLLLILPSLSLGSAITVRRSRWLCATSSRVHTSLAKGRIVQPASRDGSTGGVTFMALRRSKAPYVATTYSSMLY